MYFAKDREPEPERNVWTDDTFARLVELTEKAAEINKEMNDVRSRCNHTYRDGRSAIVKYYDDFDDGEYAVCDVCKKRL